MSSENQTPNLVRAPGLRRQTPISQRRPLQHRLAPNGPVLSPTKRRRQSHAEELKAQGAVKPAGSLRGSQVAHAVAECEPRPPLSPWEDRVSASLLLEVFARVDVRTLIGAAAPACRFWHDVAHSKELWATQRSARLVDQLLVVDKVTERRSKGRTFKCKRLGSGEMVLLRMVDLQLTNAGKDDGVPTSFLREAALLRRLQHPNIIRHHGAEILGTRVAMCTEFVFENLTSWQRRLETMSFGMKVAEIKDKFGQILTGLSHVHHQGLMHRNLKPDNIFLDQEGCVKLGDFTSTRMLDIPLQAYTPEDPKERDRSGREMRRLWYRAPELILRDEVYGPKVDAWSVGCLLAEAASGRPLFQSESEVDHLFRVFRTAGSPSMAEWPQVVTLKGFSPKFPVYSRFDLPQVTRAALGVESGPTDDMASLVRQAGGERQEILKQLLSAAEVLGPEGMHVLDMLTWVSPARRAGADEALALPFFAGAAGAPAPMTPGACDVEMHPQVQDWLHEGGCGGRGLEPGAAGLRAAGAAPRTAAPGCGCPLSQLPCLRDCVAGMYPGLGAPDAKRRETTPALPAPAEPEPRRPVPSGTEATGVPPLPALSHLMSGDMVWNIHWAMREQERRCWGGRARPLPSRPSGFGAERRARLVDFIVGLASSLGLTDFTLHLGVDVLDDFLATLAAREEVVEEQRFHTIGAACLKVADVFAEQSKEYYKQENAAEYAEATLQLTTSEAILACEKEVLPSIGFDLHKPTVQWFLQCYLNFSRFTQAGRVAKTACFIGDLGLLDEELLRYPASLRAQCAMVLAAYLVQLCDAKGRVARPRAAAPSAWTAPCAATSGGSAPSAAPSAAGRPAQGAAGARASDSELPYLEQWDTQVRRWACESNNRVDAEMCMQAVVRAFTSQRRDWKTFGLNAVEAKHLTTSRSLLYPESFPSSALTRYLLPDAPLLSSAAKRPLAQ